MERTQSAESTIVVTLATMGCLIFAKELLFGAALAGVISLVMKK